MKVFLDESEQARHVRDLDWSKTPLGDPDTWPENLCVALSICLTLPAPTQLWWGRELTLLYNEACIPLLGPRHPGVLGGRAAEAWGGRWDAIAASVDRVFDRGEPVALADGSCTLSPVRGATGVDGIVCALRNESLAMLAHELRNPLVPIVTVLHELRMTGRATPELVDMLEQQVGQITRLVDRLDGKKLVPAEPPPQARRIRVLVVDDNRAAAKALQLGLGILGCDVTIAYDTSTALLMAQEALPDVAVLDLELVNESGNELGARLRELGPIALIAVTGQGTEADRVRTQDAGFAHHLLKPTDVKLLHRTIVSAVGGGGAQDRST